VARGQPELGLLPSKEQRNLANSTSPSGMYNAERITQTFERKGSREEERERERERERESARESKAATRGMELLGLTRSAIGIKGMEGAKERDAIAIAMPSETFSIRPD